MEGLGKSAENLRIMGVAAGGWHLAAGIWLLAARGQKPAARG